jgi:hypothetical protein
LGYQRENDPGEAARNATPEHVDVYADARADQQREARAAEAAQENDAPEYASHVEATDHGVVLGMPDTFIVIRLSRDSADALERCIRPLQAHGEGAYDEATRIAQALRREINYLDRRAGK